MPRGFLQIPRTTALIPNPLSTPPPLLPNRTPHRPRTRQLRHPRRRPHTQLKPWRQTPRHLVPRIHRIARYLLDMRIVQLRRRHLTMQFCRRHCPYFLSVRGRSWSSATPHEQESCDGDEYDAESDSDAEPGFRADAHFFGALLWGCHARLTRQIWTYTRTCPCPSRLHPTHTRRRPRQPPRQTPNRKRIPHHPHRAAQIRSDRKPRILHQTTTHAIPKPLRDLRPYLRGAQSLLVEAGHVVCKVCALARAGPLRVCGDALGAFGADLRR
jgi:hypothetical protein